MKSQISIVPHPAHQQGAYENVSEYVRDLIRRDKTTSENTAFEAMKAELQLAFSEPESEYVELTAEDVFKRNAPKVK